MKIVRKKLFPLVLLSIIQDYLNYIYSANEQGENRFHQQRQK